LVLIVSHLWLRSLLAEAKRHWAATAEIIAQKYMPSPPNLSSDRLTQNSCHG